MSTDEISQLKAVALALPLSWCAIVEAYTGQLAVLPLEYRRTYGWGLCASRAAGRIFANR